jgi:protein SCO1/2
MLACSKREATLPKLGSVAAFAFTDQNGRAFSSRSLLGSPWVGAFFFTRCPTVCPKITARVKALQEFGAREHLTFKLVSISIDPDNDTPDVLLAYAHRYGLDLTRVSLLRGPSQEVQRLSEGTFKLAMSGRPDPNADHLGMIHSGHLVLVDGEGLLRGYYRSSDEEEMRRLEMDLRRLSKP